jgi:hypothetical protein
MITKQDLEALATLRLDDPQLPLQAGKASSAYYLAGYAVELGIKAVIAKSFLPNTIPDKTFVTNIYKHDLAELISHAGLLTQLKVDALVDPHFGTAWGIVSKWNEASRYAMWDAITAHLLVSAIAEPQHGVFQWLKKHW